MKSDRLIWIDLEMTGLDPEENVIIEIATIVTDGNLNVIAEGPNLAIFQPEEELDKMDEWNITHHTANGLIEAVKASEITNATAEIRTLEFLREHCEPGQAPLCGNTIGQDRRFLRAHMPELQEFVTTEASMSPVSRNCQDVGTPMRLNFTSQPDTGHWMISMGVSKNWHIIERRFSSQNNRYSIPKGRPSSSTNQTLTPTPVRWNAISSKPWILCPVEARPTTGLCRCLRHEPQPFFSTRCSGFEWPADPFRILKPR